MRDAVIQRILDEKIIAIARGYTQEECLGLAKALYAGGVTLLELTFDQKSEAARQETAEILQLLNRELGQQMCFGVGTVTTVEMVRLAKHAGAQFIISPDMDPAVIKATVEADMVSIPGVLTPTEMKQAHVAGADFVKVFPASSMGPGYIKAVAAPLSQIRMLAVGGVDGSNIGQYLAAGAVGAGVGGNLVNKNWIANGEFDKITALAKEFTTNAGL